jgi:acetyl-CoA carboxylase carboxyl transferase subunit beta
MAWFKRQPNPAGSQQEDASAHTVRTEGLWLKCEGCREIIWKRDLEYAHNVCGKCGFHFRLGARERLTLLFDDGIYEELDAALESSDPLKFVDSKPYNKRLKDTQAATSMKDALISGKGNLAGRPVHICAMEPKFIGGSMGAVMGEKITRAIEHCIDSRTPLIIVSASGGARMQEGAVSLMQMAKVSAALMRLDESRLPYISVLTDPTTGGVTASFAMLGDLNIGEPGALIGFAGPRVIEQSIRQKLPEGFQRSEFLLKHGMLDAVVPRGDMKAYLAKAFDFFVGPASVEPKPGPDSRKAA